MLRAELSSQGISVTMLCPGPVFSDILSASVTDTYEQVKNSIFHIFLIGCLF